MTDSIRPEPSPPDQGDRRESPLTPGTTGPDPLSRDPDYQKLLVHFQEAEFHLCQRLLDHLEGQYPGHPTLRKFREELELKLSVTGLAASIKKGEVRQRRLATLNLVVFAVIGTVLMVAAFYFSLNFFVNRGAMLPPAEVTPVDNLTPQLDQLYSQAQGLLQIGRPGQAEEAIDTLRSIDPDYAGLEALSARTTVLLDLEARYQSAQALAAQGEPAQALEIFSAIQSAQPGLWDVSQQVARLETEVQIQMLFDRADAAYEAENWAAVISAYQEVQALGFRLDDTPHFEQLLKAYLKQIIVLLEGEVTPIEDIEQAVAYYRKALSMIPQSREFARERSNLKEISGNLLVVKFSQAANQILIDPEQTLGSVAEAVTYTRRAANLKPNNAALQQDLQNAERYQLGLRSLTNLNWMDVITNLEPVIEGNPNYAGGNAAALLYEAYIAVAKQYYNAALYQDARVYLEKAEFIVWRDLDHLARLLQSQSLMGKTLGRSGDYENAVSYFQYALNAINAPFKLRSSPTLMQKFANAEGEASFGNFEAAFLIYQDILQEINPVYRTKEVEINDGAILALIAHQNQSVLELVAQANDLPGEMVIWFGRTVQVPHIEK